MVKGSAKRKYGHMACPDCGERVVVKINDNETLSYGCDECDSNGYCKKGEGRYPSWLKKITALAAPAPAEPPPPADKAADKEKKRARSAFAPPFGGG
jgi:hypothetical protein